MNKIWGVSALALATAGCAYVPELESEETFSYAEIVNQIQCETYRAVLEIDAKYPDAKFDQWSLGISITPNQSVDTQFSVGGVHRPDSKNPNFLQWTIGGTGASTGGASYEGYGTANAKNDYQMSLLNLFEPERNPDRSPKVVDGNRVMPKPGQPHYRELNSAIGPCTLPGGRPLVRSAVPNVLNAEGFFGIGDYLDRSFAANIRDVPSDTVQISSLVFTKEFRSKVQLGVTPGWYSAQGNVSPALGAYRQIDNTISLTFKPAGGPQRVFVVNLPTSGPATPTSPKVPKPQIAPNATRLNFKLSPETQDGLNKALDSSTIQQLQNKLQQLQ